jgi:glutamine phosphoribosylpyrophosphate amidotransferase
MCSVIGVIMKSPSTKDFELIKNVFHESRIRGLHATGLSYVKNNKIHTQKLPVPADEFPFDFPEYINEDGNLYLVGHCRYSTSDLEYNQPISNANFSVVHNGVITQELPEHWKELYGYDCVTKNDTELLLHTLEDNKSPLIHWHDASLAVCELHLDKKIRFYRNGKRPIYFTLIQNGCIITSTHDIAKRAGLKLTTEVPMSTYLTVDENLAMSIENVRVTNKDLQQVDYEYETIRI